MQCVRVVSYQIFYKKLPYPSKHLILHEIPRLSLSYPYLLIILPWAGLLSLLEK